MKTHLIVSQSIFFSNQDYFIVSYATDGTILHFVEEGQTVESLTHKSISKKDQTGSKKSVLVSSSKPGSVQNSNADLNAAAVLTQSVETAPVARKASDVLCGMSPEAVGEQKGEMRHVVTQDELEQIGDQQLLSKSLISADGIKEGAIIPKAVIESRVESLETEHKDDDELVVQD